MSRPKIPALAALLTLPAAGVFADDGGVTFAPRTPPAPAARTAGGVTLAPRVALRQDESFAPAVPDAALIAPGEPSFEPSPALPAPAASGPAAPVGGGVAFAPAVTRDDYRRAYHAVPYSRAEHLANPAYRHEAAMKLLTGEYPPARPVVAGGPAFGGGPGFAPAFGGGFGGFGFGGGFGGLGFGSGRGLGYGPAGIGGLSPAAFPGLLTDGGVAGPGVYGPAPFAFDRVQGTVPTFVNRYRPPGVYLPAR